MAQALDYLRRSSRGSARRGGTPPTWPLTGKPITPTPQKAQPTLNWLRKPTDDGRSEQLGWLKNYKQERVQEQPDPNYSATLRERMLSNVMGPRRNNYDVGFNDVWTLDVLNRMWGSSSVTEQERILRQNATQPGLMWTPYGYQGRTAYVPIKNLDAPEKKLRSSYTPAVPSTNYGGSGGGYGYGYGYGGGGGGGGGGASAPNWYSDLMTWKIK